jgi:hypothetical protein
MIRRLLQPVPALAAALLAVYLAVTYLDHGWRRPVAIVLVPTLVVALVFVAGRILFKYRPYYGGFLIEFGLAVQFLAAGVAGALLIWLLIEKAPKSATPTTREKEVWAAVSGAITAYLGSIIIKPEGELGNPVKSAIRSVFGERFKGPTDGSSDRRTLLERDARSAVQENEYPGSASTHVDHVVKGWGWDARRLRTRHIQDQLLSS